MNSQQEDLIMRLTGVLQPEKKISREEFLRQWGAHDGHALGLELLRDAIERQDGRDADLAMIVCSIFGYTSDHLELLLELVPSRWHQKHEDAVFELAKLRDPASIDVLFLAAKWVPDYLDFDESRALARKAVRGLVDIPGKQAEDALMRLLDTDDALVRGEAKKMLERRGLL
jgi:hypothetical protein